MHRYFRVVILVLLDMKKAPLDNNYRAINIKMLKAYETDKNNTFSTYA